MEISRFNQLSSVFGKRLSRRDTVKYTGLGLGAAGVSAYALGQSAAAQSATPAVGSEETAGLPQGERTYTMFIQTAQGGTWEPKAGEEGVYTLTLTGLPAQTVYFSDRPERLVGTQSTADFLHALGFSGDNPPNAALVTTNGGDNDVLVIELFNPVYTEGADETGATLVYDARILDNYLNTGLGRVALEQDNTDIPSAFDGASLFIDDCADGIASCEDANGTILGYANYGCCYKFPICTQCGDISHICDSVPGCENDACGPGDYKDCFI